MTHILWIVDVKYARDDAVMDQQNDQHSLPENRKIMKNLLQENFRSIVAMNLRKGEENHRLDAQKFPNGLHRFQSLGICAVEQNQAIHRSELGQIIKSDHVGICHVSAKLSLTVNSV